VLRFLSSSCRTQVFLLWHRRTYDRSVAGLCAGNAQRYFAYDFDRRSNRLLDPGRIEAIKVVASSNAVLHAFGQYSNAVLDRVEIGEGDLREKVRIASTG